MIPDIPLVDIRTSDLTLSETMAAIEAMQAVHGDDFEIFMDGDAYAIVARLRGVRA